MDGKKQPKNTSTTNKQTKNLFRREKKTKKNQIEKRSGKHKTCDKCSHSRNPCCGNRMQLNTTEWKNGIKFIQRYYCHHKRYWCCCRQNKRYSFSSSDKTPSIVHYKAHNTLVACFFIRLSFISVFIFPTIFIRWGLLLCEAFYIFLVIFLVFNVLYGRCSHFFLYMHKCIWIRLWRDFVCVFGFSFILFMPLNVLVMCDFFYSRAVFFYSISFSFLRTKWRARLLSTRIHWRIHVCVNVIRVLFSIAFLALFLFFLSISLSVFRFHFHLSFGNSGLLLYNTTSRFSQLTQSKHRFCTIFRCMLQQ